MQIIFDGATETVTGSCTLIKANGKHILVDCGLYQGYGVEQYNARNMTFDPKKVDYILLTHAHIDHSGKIPYLVKKGFRGKVICSRPTKDVCEIVLPDSGYIQQKMKKWDLSSKKRGLILYDVEDAIKSLEQFEAIEYNKEYKIDENIKVKMIHSGHMLGSAYIEVYVTEKNKESKLLFTGDIGNQNNNLLPLQQEVKEADVVVIESTYGNRLHTLPCDEVESVQEQLIKEIKKVVDAGGKLIIPAFAVGRAQELVTHLKDIYNEIEDKYKIPVYVDSPLTVKAFEVYNQNLEYLSECARKKFVEEFSPLKFVEDIEESAYISNLKKPVIIISASGMADFGRVKEHIKNNIGDERNTILLSGYVAEGTLGRKLKKGSRNVKIDGEKLKSRARVKQIKGMSGHVDMDGLISFINNISTKEKQIFINHGTQEAKHNLKQKILAIHGKNTEVIIPKREEIHKIKMKKKNSTSKTIYIKVPENYEYKKLLEEQGYVIT